MERISDDLDNNNEYSQEEFDLISLYFGEAEQLPFDKEGRIVMPKKLVEHALIKMKCYLWVWDLLFRCGILKNIKNLKNLLLKERVKKTKPSLKTNSKRSMTREQL